ncbi:MAG TPA: hypothetical protein VG942_16700 [Hyphomonadaceae bacterium]|nr:hypothetical protein [Hyphomonadaceae bacterium]
MTTPHSHQDRASEAASYADRLQGDLINLSGMLDHYRDGHGVAGLEALREQSASSQQRLKAIAQRLDALGESADPGKYALSDKEHAVIDEARNVREHMMQTLDRLQRRAK